MHTECVRSKYGVSTGQVRVLPSLNTDGLRVDSERTRKMSRLGYEAGSQKAASLDSYVVASVEQMPV